MDIDIWEVIRAASTKPFGFTPFYPGPGLGGHCIPIDPFYLTWKAREYGVHTRFIELAGEINRSMPKYVVNRAMEALNTRGKAVKRHRVIGSRGAVTPSFWGGSLRIGQKSWSRFFHAALAINNRSHGTQPIKTAYSAAMIFSVFSRNN
jgi:hypothetical protein